MAAYVAYHRNVPTLVQLFVWYFGAPQLLPAAAGAWINNHNGEFVFALIALSLNAAAYLSEDLRSGVRSIARGQVEAARALGLGYAQTMLYVVLPQAVRVAVPGVDQPVAHSFQDHQPRHGDRRGRNDVRQPPDRERDLSDVRNLHDRDRRSTCWSPSASC